MSKSKYLFAQFVYENRFRCDIFLVDAGETTFVCSLPIKLLSKTADDVEGILAFLTERYGRIRVRPSRFDDIPTRFKRYFVSLSEPYNPLYHGLGLEEEVYEDYAGCSK